MVWGWSIDHTTHLSSQQAVSVTPHIFNDPWYRLHMNFTDCIYTWFDSFTLYFFSNWSNASDLFGNLLVKSKAQNMETLNSDLLNLSDFGEKLKLSVAQFPHQQNGINSRKWWGLNKVMYIKYLVLCLVYGLWSLNIFCYVTAVGCSLWVLHLHNIHLTSPQQLADLTLFVNIKSLLFLVLESLTNTVLNSWGGGWGHV